MSELWTPERKEQQRQLAKRLVEEGKFGGAGRGQGRPRKPRATEEAARLLAGEGRVMYDAIMEVMQNGTHSNKILAVREARAIEESERKIEIQDERNNIDDMRKDHLLAFVVGKILELGEKGVIPNEIIDGEAELVAIERSSESSETTR
jgi:hypothetical protein